MLETTHIFLLAFVEDIDAVAFFIAALLGYMGLGIILYGGLKGFVRYIVYMVTRYGDIPSVRIDIARHLSLGLEFFVARDIISTIVHPSWEELGKLGAIVVLRTAVALFLDYELDRAKARLGKEPE